MTWNFHLCAPVRASYPRDVARHVLDAGLVVALLGRVAHHDHPVDDDRGGRAGDVAQLSGDAEVGVVGAVPALPRPPVGDQVRQQVDHPGARKPRQRHRRPPVLEGPPGPGVEGVEEEGGADRVDDAAAVDLGVGDALAVPVPHAPVEPGSLRLAERPQRLSRRGVDRGHGAALAGHGIQRAVDVDRGRTGHPEPSRPEVVAPPDPRHLEVLEVVGGHLVERRVAGMRRVAPDVAPFAGVLGERRRRGQEDGRDDDGPRRPTAGTRSDCHPLSPSLVATAPAARLSPTVRGHARSWAGPRPRRDSR